VYKEGGIIMTTYDQMERLIKNRTPFIGNSVHAELNSDGSYVIYSYKTVIAQIEDNGDIYFDNRYWSNTTNKIQSIIKECIPFSSPFYFGKRGGKHYIRERMWYKNGIWRCHYEDNHIYEITIENGENKITKYPIKGLCGTLYGFA
jgi:hypothetical protein